MENQSQKGQDVVDNLVIVDAIVPTFHEQLWPRLFGLFPRLLLALRSRYAVVRQLAARAFATICDVATSEAMRYVIDYVLPLLGDALVVTNRQGAIELIYRQSSCVYYSLLSHLIRLQTLCKNSTSKPFHMSSSWSCLYWEE